ncbi:hypothetical protein GQ53DRAFT_820955 [Thozetella sp. PMI_491]|nr:hypothetical protein GQ53DRAFT_820955 [Thozetella sp. PMI_491]
MASAWPTVLDSSPYTVHLGTWTNWSRGRIFGATLTLTQSDASLLIAFTAFFVTLVAARLWRIVCLAIHRLFTTPHPRDGLHHQRQAILRNSASALAAVSSLGLLFWAWRGIAKGRFARVFPTLAFATLFSVAFAVATGFSSRISTAVGSEVLVDGSNCGLVIGVPAAGNISTNAILDKQAEEILNTLENYAQQCYAANGSGLLSCSTFIVQRLPSSIDTNASCPFDAGICRSNSSNLLLDTGYLDSNDHFGVNYPPEKRILYRSVMHCAPLVTDGYTSNFTTVRQNYTRYNYGPTVQGTLNNLTQLNYTYQIEDLATQYQDRFRLNASPLLAPLLSDTINRTSNPGADFIPVEELFRADGDLLLVFLSGYGVDFLEPTEDEWYRANTPGPNLSHNDNEGSIPSWIPEDAASPMACLQQYQFCNTALPSGEACARLESSTDAAIEALALFNTTYDELISNSAVNELASQFSWYTWVLTFSNYGIYSYLQEFGANSLDSRSGLAQGVQLPMPVNQWQLDVTHWWATMLAGLQAAWVQAARGVTSLDLQPFTFLPNSSYQKQFCNSQKIQSSEHASFSMFGLCFTFITGGIIIVISFILEPLLSYLHRKRSHKSYAYLEWVSNETLQLHRFGYDSVGSGTWSHCTDSVPITSTDEPLTGLDLSEPQHPRLGWPSVTFMETNQPLAQFGASGEGFLTNEQSSAGQVFCSQDTYGVSSIPQQYSDTVYSRQPNVGTMDSPPYYQRDLHESRNYEAYNGQYQSLGTYNSQSFGAYSGPSDLSCNFQTSHEDNHHWARGTG